MQAALLHQPLWHSSRVKVPRRYAQVVLRLELLHECLRQLCVLPVPELRYKGRASWTEHPGWRDEPDLMCPGRRVVTDDLTDLASLDVVVIHPYPASDQSGSRSRLWARRDGQWACLARLLWGDGFRDVWQTRGISRTAG